MISIWWRCCCKAGLDLTLHSLLKGLQHLLNERHADTPQQLRGNKQQLWRTWLLLPTRKANTLAIGISGAAEV
jgi:hypothetical protein